MIIEVYGPGGIITSEPNKAELVAMAKTGNHQALRELIADKGGCNNLTSAQRDKAIRMYLIGDVEL